MNKRLSILGSTGSIGTQTLKIVDGDKGLSVAALAAHSDIETLFRQTLRYQPELVCVYDETKAAAFAEMLSEARKGRFPAGSFSEEISENACRGGEENLESGKTDGTETGVAACAARIPDCRVVSGIEGLCEAASCESADTIVVAVVGMIGIRPTIAAIKAHKEIALANKETLVCAGHIIMPMLKEYGVRLMPVDSEHSAIYQCLAGEEKASVEKLLLTASGGPFRGYTKEMLKDIRPEDALKHPNWAMGAKITIDSSTMINKALEVMEAHWLFDVPVEDIEIVIQPQSVIHSMVQFKDGSVKAQLGVPSMLIPIEYALYAPGRTALSQEEKLDFKTLLQLTFSVPDMEVFRGLALGIEAGIRGGSLPTVFNAANEEVVAAFLAKQIGYTDIPDGIEAAMRAHEVIDAPDVEEILSTEAWARAFIRKRYRL